jgi:CcmD family protein
MDHNYIAMIVTLIVWLGLFLYLTRLDRRIRDLEKRRD